MVGAFGRFFTRLLVSHNKPLVGFFRKSFGRPSAALELTDVQKTRYKIKLTKSVGVVLTARAFGRPWLLISWKCV